MLHIRKQFQSYIVYTSVMLVGGGMNEILVVHVTGNKLLWLFSSKSMYLNMARFSSAATVEAD